MALRSPAHLSFNIRYHFIYRLRWLVPQVGHAYILSQAIFKEISTTFK